MVAIHPSLTLVFDLDERLGTQQTKLEIDRCYSYVTQPLVRTHKAPETAEGENEAEDVPGDNVARYIVSMGQKKYLKSSDEGADELWSTSVEPWLSSMFFKIGNTAAAFNKRMRKIGLPEVNFDRADIVLQGGEFTVGLKPDPEQRIGRPVSAQVGLARQLLNSGVLEGAVRVNAPSAESWATQVASAHEEWDAEHPDPEEEQEEAAQKAAEEAPEPSGVLKHTAGPMPDERKDPEAFAAWEKADREAKSYENTAVPPTDSDELPPIGNPVEAPEAPRFDFDVDYSVWDVFYADGTKRVFDSKTQTYLD